MSSPLHERIADKLTDKLTDKVCCNNTDHSVATNPFTSQWTLISTLTSYMLHEQVNYMNSDKMDIFSFIYP